MTAMNQFVVKDATLIRSDITRTIKNGLVSAGFANPNIGPSSDWYIIATALGNELAVVGASAIVKCDQIMPDSAVGADLARWGNILGLSLQSAAGSLGSIVFSASATSPVPTNTGLTDAAGLRYHVTLGGNYSDGASIPIVADDVGTTTNHQAGDVLQWASAPPFADQHVKVDVGGLVNGIDNEIDEGYRARIFAKFQNAPGSGNPEHVAEIAEKSTAHVQKAFIYPAVQGPSTADVAVAAAPTATQKAREISTPVMNGTVIPTVIGTLPPPVNLTVTTVASVNTDVAFALILPESPTANPPGPGGGWTNGTPWPRPDGAFSFRCTVTAVSSGNAFTVDALTAPIDNVTRIAWLSPLTWQLYTALVTSHSGSAGAYAITTDVGFPSIMVGAHIWPECQNAQTYVNDILAAFALMGPGEKTANASALVRGFRHPPPATAWPYTLGPHLLRALTNENEVQASQFYHRTDGTTTLTGSSGVLSPQVPGSLSSAPNIFVPRHISFYRLA